MLRHATNEHGDCAHWCRACALADRIGVPRDTQIEELRLREQATNKGVDDDLLPSL